jgi:hypothetical protein
LAAWALIGATRQTARGFDDPQKQRFQGEGPGPAQRRASTDPAGSGDRDTALPNAAHTMID